MTEVSCQGELIAVFSEADLHCLSQSGYDSCNFKSYRDGYLSLFHLTSQKRIYIVRRMDGFDENYDIMRYSWSPDSLHLLVYWRPELHNKLYVACLSRRLLSAR